MRHLTTTGFRINEEDINLTATQHLEFLGFSIDTASDTVRHTPAHLTVIRRLLNYLEGPLRVRHSRRVTLQLAFYQSVYGSCYLLLRPPFDTISQEMPVDVRRIRFIQMVWTHFIILIPSASLHFRSLPGQTPLRLAPALSCRASRRCSFHHHRGPST